jgi:transposase-like protein
MTDPAVSYHGYRFPPEIISHALWLYHRFCLSLRDTEDLLAGVGAAVAILVAVHASLAPARRAASVQPMVAMRSV